VAESTTYELHGLRVRSEIPLGGSVRPEGTPDLDVRWGSEPMPPAAEPDGRVLARVAGDDGRGYTHTQAGAGYLLRFHGLCEVRIDGARRAMDVRVSVGGDRAMVPLLVAGNSLAFVLTLAGERVLHASAVQANGSALAFVGAPGMGKSTLAALLCASGATLITDDLLRLAPDGAEFRCCFGPAEIRLRANAAELARSFPGVAAAPTPDGRVAIRLGHAGRPMPRLGTVVIPRPMRTRTTLAVRQLAPAAALFALSRYPRVAGLCAPELLASQFRAFAQVASSVPVYEAEVPWGPPFAPGLADALVEAVA